MFAPRLPFAVWAVLPVMTASGAPLMLLFSLLLPILVVLYLAHKPFNVLEGYAVLHLQTGSSLWEMEGESQRLNGWKDYWRFLVVHWARTELKLHPCLNIISGCSLPPQPEEREEACDLSVVIHCSHFWEYILLFTDDICLKTQRDVSLFFTRMWMWTGYRLWNRLPLCVPVCVGRWCHVIMGSMWVRLFVIFLLFTGPCQYIRGKTGFMRTSRLKPHRLRR